MGFINGKKMVAEPGKVKIEDLGNGKHQITLQNVTAGDAGVISCIAKNEAGEAKCKAQIAIEVTSSSMKRSACVFSKNTTGNLSDFYNDEKIRLQIHENDTEQLMISS